jgi:acetyl/propionyl-CoA carboxylase alpha subunit
MGEAAVAAARAVGYVNAGTVEFLLDGDDFFFLEMNTRLQVEHPVTEMATGLDLVAVQIRLAEGEPMPAEVTDAEVHGHAIEARLYAEDPANGFLPATGLLHRFSLPPSVRTDAGPGDGSEISVHYDPMLAKVVAHAPTREEAAAKLAHALATAELYGPKTNRDLLVRILRSPEFLAGDTDTALLDRLDVADLSAPLTSDHRLHALAATMAGQAGRRQAAPVLGSIPSGWRNAPSQLNHQGWRSPSGVIEIGYRFDRNGLTVEIDGTAVAAELHATGAGVVDLTVDRIRRRYRVHRAGRHMWVSSGLGQSELVQISRFLPPTATDAPGSLLSPMPGRVVEVAAQEGGVVARGDTVVIIEAMKMEHAVKSPADGVVSSIPVTVGQQVQADQVLAVVEATGSEG